MAATAAAVRRALTAGGMATAKWVKSSRIKGWGNWHEGVLAENMIRLELEDAWGKIGRGKNAAWGPKKKAVKVPTGEVTIKWISGSWSTGDIEAARAQKLAQAGEILTARGYVIEQKTDEYGAPYLSVTKGE